MSDWARFLEISVDTEPALRWAAGSELRPTPFRTPLFLSLDSLTTLKFCARAVAEYKIMGDIKRTAQPTEAEISAAIQHYKTLMTQKLERAKLGPSAIAKRTNCRIFKPWK